MPVTDFDFLPGRWNVHNRRLVDPLDPACAEWEEFPAVSVAERMLGGVGNLDHFITDGYEGFSLRLHDPVSDTWRIWWSSTQRPGRLDPPVAGRFAADGTATFACSDEIDGVAFEMRFVWSEITGDHALWTQSFSFDGGATWKPNWEMTLDRAEG